MNDPKRATQATIALADGFVLRGVGFGAVTKAVGEVVFNTSMTGYQEILTDPSYRGQLVCLTVPEIGNVGCNPEDDESVGWGAQGLIVRSLSPVVSNWRARSSLAEHLAARGLPGIAEVDTRALTRHIRQLGAVMGAVATDGTPEQELIALARGAEGMEGRALGQEVSCTAAYDWCEPSWGRPSPAGQGPGKVVVVDFGVKLNILRQLRDHGLTVRVVPGTSSARDILALQPDGVLLSNGPGDPAALGSVIEQIRELLARAPELPVFGICLGHQLLSLALGARTYKLKFGHHGGNHPVRVQARAGVEITAQNHGFAVDPDSLTRAGSHGATVSHTNLFDGTVAGIKVVNRPWSSVQFHPEASPGPHDSQGLFAEFVREIERRPAREDSGRG